MPHPQLQPTRIAAAQRCQRKLKEAIARPTHLTVRNVEIRPLSGGKCAVPICIPSTTDTRNDGMRTDGTEEFPYGSLHRQHSR